MKKKLPVIGLSARAELCSVLQDILGHIPKEKEEPIDVPHVRIDDLQSCGVSGVAVEHYAVTKEPSDHPLLAEERLISRRARTHEPDLEEPLDFETDR